MMLQFQTERELITFGLGSKYVCSTVTGLNEGTVNRRKINYIDTDGAEFTDDLYEERTILIEGYMQSGHKNELNDLRARLTHICNGKSRGKLICENGSRRYFTEVIAELPEFGERTGRVQLFSCKFIAYRFFWKDYCETKAVVVSFQNYIKSTFTFPLVFTAKTSKAMIVNSGTISAELILEIRCTESGTAGGTLTIYNHTTEKSIILNYDMTAGERLTIDTLNCDIVSDKNGNLLKHMDPTSTFFKLQQGTNELEVTNTDSDCVYSCVCRHYNAYVGV